MPRRKLPENLTIIAEKGYRPQFVDGLQAFPELTEAYYALLEMHYPRLDNTVRYIRGAENSPLVPDIKKFHPRGIFHTFTQMNPDQREAWSRLFLLTYAALVKARLDGITHGRDLLAQLARGEITVGEFERGSSQT